MRGEDSIRTVLKMVAMSEPFHHKNTRYVAVGKVNYE